MYTPAQRLQVPPLASPYNTSPGSVRLDTNCKLVSGCAKTSTRISCSKGRATHLAARHSSRTQCAQTTGVSSDTDQQRAIPLPEEGVAWDPEGLLASSTPQEGHLARRARERAARLTAKQTNAAQIDASQTTQHVAPLVTAAWATSTIAAALASTRTPSNSVSTGPAPAAEQLPPIRSLPTEHCNEGVLLAGQHDLCGSEALRQALAANYVPVNLQHPGLRVHNLDPPVFTVDSFLSPEDCEQLVQAVADTGKLQASKVGEGSVQSAAAALNQRRTSSSLLLDSALLAQHPHLSGLVDQLHQKARMLLPTGTWNEPGRLPRPQQYCFESLQVACYQQGQHFLEHEDGFPRTFVEENQFQRQATLLLYLNDVEEGGRTRFSHLDLSIKPRCGRALLFYPAFADGNPDPRTLHTAEAAGDTKWIAQVWVACGHAAAAANTLPLPSLSSLSRLRVPTPASQRSAFSGLTGRGIRLDSVKQDASPAVEKLLVSARKTKGTKPKTKPKLSSKGF